MNSGPKFIPRIILYLWFILRLFSGLPPVDFNILLFSMRFSPLSFFIILVTAAGVRSRLPDSFILEILLFILISSFIMILPGFLVHNLFHLIYTSRVLDILVMMLCGVIMVLVYYGITVFLGLPQAIFNIKEATPRALLKKFRA